MNSLKKAARLAELCEYMISITDTQLPVSVTSLTSLSSFEEFRDQITWRLISRDKNKELLKTIPWIPFLDLAVIFSLIIESEGENPDQLCRHEHGICFLECDSRRTLCLAKENTPRIFPASFRRLKQ